MFFNFLIHIKSIFFENLQKSEKREEALLEISKMEGIIPAIETAHAFAVLDKKQFKPTDIVVINLSGRGDKDLNTYIDYFNLSN